MSETDDTDILLLIPPGFFLVKSSGSDDSLLDSSRTVVRKPTSCTAKVIGQLVSQVNSLESRLDSLELSTASDTISSFSTRSRHRQWENESVGNRSLDRKCFTFPRRRRRKISTKKENRLNLSVTSVNSVSTTDSKKKIPLLELKDNTKPLNHPNVISPIMDEDISSIVSTPSKKNDKLLLHEIDEFLTKVESYESPESKYKSQDVLRSENLIKATGDYISNNLDNRNSVSDITLPSGRIVSSNVLDKYIYLAENNPPTSPLGKNQNKQTNSSLDCNTKNIHLKSKQETSSSMRKLNFTEDKDVQPTSTPKRYIEVMANYSDSFRPSSNKIYDRAARVLEQYKSNSSSQTKTAITDSSIVSPHKEEFKMPQMRPYIPESKDALKFAALQNKLMESMDTDLISLSDLWGEKEVKSERVDSVKLEEERLKREHCEAMIQQLQKNLLEQHEKIAVAMKVDRAKDAAINKLKTAWLKLTTSLDRAEERHRSALDKMVREVENFKVVADDAQKKTNHFEAELYKALDLAHDYQDKCKQIMTEKKEFQELMEKNIAIKEELLRCKEKEIDMLKDNYDTVTRLNKQATDCIKNLEDTLEQEKSEHGITKTKANELNRKIKSINEENSLLTQERDLLKNKVNEERSRCNIIEQQLCEKQNQCSDLLKKCDYLDSEVKSLQKNIELQKNELKAHYQKQLEEAVMSKLQEFQTQLDCAEREMESDARTKENAIVDTYNKQMSRIEEQHKLEINLLEEKHKEEMKLCRLQLVQAHEKIGLLENKVESFRRRRGEIASQLHSVMESQWRQALLILTNGHGGRSSRDVTRSDSVASGGAAATDYGPPRVPPLTMPQLAERGLTRPDRRAADFNFEGLSDCELQQYVQLLLTKPPNLEASAATASSGQPERDVNEEPTSDRPDKGKLGKRGLNVSKPPWKA